MVRGLELFKEHFKDYGDHYVLIGGAACDLAMEAVGESFRATKDLDIVLCIESLDSGFVNAFWEFVKAGAYEVRQRNTGKKLFYRFHSPGDVTYPYMLELFSRIPDALHFEGEGHLTPIPTEEDVSSLSAILLDEDYYALLHEGKTEMAGVPVVRPEYILPLKARAWLDLTARKEAGGHVDGTDVKKHRADVFRLYRILIPGEIPKLSGQVSDDLHSFLEAMKGENLELKPFGYKNVKLDDVVTEIGISYGIPSQS